MTADNDAVLRERLAQLLESGLQTEWKNRADTSEQVDAVTKRLQQLADDDYPAKLEAAGFTTHPFLPAGADIEESCSTCVRFERIRRFCNLPELAIPVEPEWSCVVWRL